jgi:hypothetical protein
MAKKKTKKKQRPRAGPRADPRTRAVEVVAADGVPLAKPERHAAYQPVTTDNGQVICFPAPFAWTLNLDLARTLRDRGERTRRRAFRAGSLSPMVLPDGTASKAATDETATHDALAYLSAEMIERLEPGETVKVGRDEVERDDMTRVLSIEEKLKRAVPLATGRHIAGDSRLWGKFKALKQLRDELVHLKERGYSPDPDAPSPYSRLMRGDAAACVEDAAALIEAMRENAAP